MKIHFPFEPKEPKWNDDDDNSNMKRPGKQNEYKRKRKMEWQNRETPNHTHTMHNIMRTRSLSASLFVCTFDKFTFVQLFCGITVLKNYYSIFSLSLRSSSSRHFVLAVGPVAFTLYHIYTIPRSSSFSIAPLFLCFCNSYCCCCCVFSLLLLFFFLVLIT